MKIKLCLLLFLVKVVVNPLQAQEIIHLADWGVKPNTFTNSSPALKAAIEGSQGKKDVVLMLPGGRIDLWPEGSFKKELYISNTTESDTSSKVKNIAFWLEDLDNFTIEGNHTLVVLHGKMTSFALNNSRNIRIQNISFDYERPTMSEITIRSVSDDVVETEIHPDSRYMIDDGRIVFYGEGWKTNAHHTILFRPELEAMFYSNFRPFLNSTAIETDPFRVRFEGDFSGTHFRPGDVLTTRDPYRDNSGGFINRSTNVSLYNVNMHFMHGMGIVSQFSENISFRKVRVAPREESGRIIAAFADVFHFSGCKGLITIDSSYTSGSHDDPINIHGTHMKITEIHGENKMRVRFMHHQSYGFEAFFAGDSIAFVHARTLQPVAYGTVKSAKLVNLREMEIELDGTLPENAETGQVIENITWTPEVHITNNFFTRVNTRGLLVTTRRKVVIENNHFSHTGMHGILIANDASSWYESGPVSDVTIRNNVFENCGYNSAPNNYIIAISPQNHDAVDGFYVHRNIRIENNRFRVYDSPIITARSTEGLSFLNNIIERKDFGDLPRSNRPDFFLNQSRNVVITGNTWKTAAEPVIKLDRMQEADVKTDLNIMN